MNFGLSLCQLGLLVFLIVGLLVDMPIHFFYFVQGFGYIEFQGSDVAL